MVIKGEISHGVSSYSLMDIISKVGMTDVMLTI